jgi:hypothetical protein
MEKEKGGYGRTCGGYEEDESEGVEEEGHGGR